MKLKIERKKMNVKFETPETSNDLTQVSMHQNVLANQPKIAVRLYENKKFGRTYGPAKYYDALFNATADILMPPVKYLLDFVPYNQWTKSRSLQSCQDISEYLNDTIQTQSINPENLLVSWIKRYNSNRQKIFIDGFTYYNLANGEILMLIIDKDYGIENVWILNAHICRSSGIKNSPQLLAVNYELN
jgi:hypothetical protein